MQKRFLNRSKNYKNTWNTEKQLFCPKSLSGEWNCPDLWTDVFDQRFVEGDAWQWRWFVPHDPTGLMSLFNDTQHFVSQLDEFFSRSEYFESNFMPNPYYWAGNEPDIFAAYLFAYAGRADLTQRYVRWNMDNKYTTGPGGLPGNDDYGTMSAWFVFNALGFYPQPATPDSVYILGSPLFQEVTVHLPSGDLHIIAHDNSANNYFVEKVMFNEQPLSGPFLYHTNFTSGTNNTLEFWMNSA